MHGLSLKLLMSYLLDRTQCVKIGASTSKHALITCRVSQESVLGQLLFLVYISNIHKSDSRVQSSEASFHLFAGWHKPFLCRQEYKKTRSKNYYLIRKYKNWLNANKLNINIDKSQLLFFDLSPTDLWTWENWLPWDFDYTSIQNTIILGGAFENSVASKLLLFTNIWRNNSSIAIELVLPWIYVAIQN